MVLFGAALSNWQELYVGQRSNYVLEMPIFKLLNESSLEKQQGGTVNFSMDTRCKFLYMYENLYLYNHTYIYICIWFLLYTHNINIYMYIYISQGSPFGSRVVLAAIRTVLRVFSSCFNGL